MTCEIPNSELLEAFNGVWAILAAYCMVFLLVHLHAAGERQRLTGAGWLCRLPLGMQIAAATAGACLGVFLSRGGMWYWRLVFDGDPAKLGVVAMPVGSGAVIGATSFLFILWVVTRPIGLWPLASAIGTVLVYLATFYPFG